MDTVWLIGTREAGDPYEYWATQLQVYSYTFGYDIRNDHVGDYYDSFCWYNRDTAEDAQWMVNLSPWDTNWWMQIIGEARSWGFA